MLGFSLFILVNVLRAKFSLPCLFGLCMDYMLQGVRTPWKYHQQLFRDFYKRCVAGLLQELLKLCSTANTFITLIIIFSLFCLCRGFVSPGPFQSVHRESADVCGEQRGCLCPAGAEDTGTVPAGYLCGQHLWAQWVHAVQFSVWSWNRLILSCLRLGNISSISWTHPNHSQAGSVRQEMLRLPQRLFSDSWLTNNNKIHVVHCERCMIHNILKISSWKVYL